MQEARSGYLDVQESSSGYSEVQEAGSAYLVVEVEEASNGILMLRR